MQCEGFYNLFLIYVNYVLLHDRFQRCASTCAGGEVSSHFRCLGIIAGFVPHFLLFFFVPVLIIQELFVERFLSVSLLVLVFIFMMLVIAACFLVCRSFLETSVRISMLRDELSLLMFSGIWCSSLIFIFALLFLDCLFSGYSHQICRSVLFFINIGMYLLCLLLG